MEAKNNLKAIIETLNEIGKDHKLRATEFGYRLIESEEQNKIEVYYDYLKPDRHNRTTVIMLSYRHTEDKEQAFKNAALRLLTMAIYAKDSEDVINLRGSIVKIQSFKTIFKADLEAECVKKV